MTHDPNAWLWDALQAAKAIEGFLDGVDGAQYAASDFTMSAVERKFEIIGEALNNYAKADPDGAARMADLPEIVAFRNKIIHGYRQIKPERVFQIAKTRLPRLKMQLETALAGKAP